MKIKSALFLLTTFLFFVYLVKSVSATSFTSSVTPSSLSAGSTNQLLNFTINNIGTSNITKVYIYPPSGFSFTGTSDSTITSKYHYTHPSDGTWLNESTIGIIPSGDTEYFWVHVDTPHSTGDFNFNITVEDVDGVYNSTNIKLTLFDTTPPQYSNNITSPSSPTMYSPGKKYQFNITWTDNVAVDTVLFENNFTHPLSNDTVYNESSTYFFNVTDLPAGTYVFRWYANDTNDSFSSTPQYIYVVDKSSNPINIWFNTSKNKDIVITNSTTVIVNVTGIGTITLYEDDTSRQTGTSSLSYSTVNSPLYSTNKYNFTAVASGNENYTSNSSSYLIMVVPNYDTSGTSIPSTYSSTASVFKIVFSSASGLDNVLLETDYSGSSVKYKMSNSLNTTYTYSVKLPAGSFHWQIFGNYSGYIFSLTSKKSFTISKATPSINLISSPGWTVSAGIQTEVLCVISPDFLTIKLYRNGSLVSNPDSQTFNDIGSYVYLCNSTETQNYSSASVSNTLTITSAPTANLSLVEVPTLVFITQNSTNTTLISVKNTGNVYQNITFSFGGINESWWTVNSTNVNLAPGSTTGFLIIFSIGGENLGNYSGIFNITSPNVTLSSNFTLQVLPSEETKAKINETINNYKIREGQLELEINQTKSEGIKTDSVELVLNQLKSKIAQAENFTKNGDYISAKNLFGTIDNLIAATQNELAKVKQSVEQQRQSNFLIYVIVGIVATAIIGILVYLFWPTEIKSKTPPGIPTRKLKKESIFQKMKEKLVKKKKYQYRG